MSCEPLTHLDQLESTIAALQGVVDLAEHDTRAPFLASLFQTLADRFTMGLDGLHQEHRHHQCPLEKATNARRPAHVP